MKAIVTTGGGPTGFRFADVAEPRPLPDQAVVQVEAASVNRGDTFWARNSPAGTVRGYDYAGVVLTPAADGSGPPAGARVAGAVAQGAWAERVAAAGHTLATIPDDVAAEQAAATPVAGMTALYALQRAGWLLGRRVLITGAAGGVGVFAVQLAARGGAHVTALVGSAERGAGLTELGADVVGTYDNPPAGGADVLVESAGGKVFTTAMSQLNPHGIAVSVGNSAGAEVVLPPDYGLSRRNFSYSWLSLLDEVGRRRTGGNDLRFLLDLIAAGRLDPRIGETVRWDDFGPIIEKLWNRQISGKAILTLG
ncbi:zinc-binding dehydrogenase [Fodinicola acaciae]|uniref:zinc-binding dehydrogenase n=1 Tax=Fodinicola acaciae TaxID=2681555 RepID=UPI0013D0E6F4|nr:zinc-binding dehydrogenase [Fodinicola acaciae]